MKVGDSILSFSGRMMKSSVMRFGMKLIRKSTGRGGEPREKEDKEILHGFLGKEKDFIELHELWLRKEYRGKGYGKRFFEFFEEYMRRKDYDSLVYYAFDPAAVAICRRRGYKEAYGLKEAGPYGKIETMYVFYLRLRKN